MTRRVPGRERGSLAQRIFAGLTGFSVLAMVIFAVAAISMFYSSYESDAEYQLVNQVRQTASQLEGKSVKEEITYLQSVPWSGLRCTLIKQDGTVMYDNQVDVSQLGNHSDRTEFKQARANGESSVLRYSDTLGEDTIYAAERLTDGNVIRLAETRHSLISFLEDMLPSLLLAALLIVVVGFGLSRVLTRRIMRPIDRMDLSNPLSNDIYVEMRPLMQRISDQQNQLRKQNEELEAAVETRREFSANVSHEMKTPLQVISGYSELMQAGMVSQADTAKFAGLIHSEAESMRALIDDVLTLSRLDESALGQAEISDVDLVWVAQQVAERLKAVADERQVTVELEPTDGPIRVHGAETLLEETFYNLIDNAIRYNHPGGKVTVAFRSEERDGGKRAIFTVSDTGPGIPPEMRERVFERFYRLEEGRSRETGGTGLGLAIVKHAVQRYDGSVTIKDAPGGGSEFVVDLPAAT